MSRYTMGVDLGGPEGYDSFVVYDTRTSRFLWSDTVKAGDRKPRFPWWVRFQFWLGNVAVVRETNTHERAEG